MKMKKALALMLAGMMAFATGGVSTFAKEPVAAEKSVETGKKVATYLPCWASKEWSVDDIQGDKLTHVYLAFARIDNNFQICNDDYRIIAEDGSFMLQDLVKATLIEEETFAKVAKLKEKYPHLKVIVAVGGWLGEGFSDMVASPSTREIFADSVKAYIEKYNLDGIDIDWEYPVGPPWGGHPTMTRPEDKENFTALMEVLRKKLGPDKEIGFCAPVNGWFLDAVEFEKVVPLIDSVSLMTYDMFGAWSDEAQHQGPLYPNPENPLVDWGCTVSETVDRLVKAGVPAEKMIVGIHTYGREFRNIVADEKGDPLYQPWAKDAEGNPVTDRTTWRGSVIPWTYLRDYYIGKHGYKEFWDDVSKAPYLYDGKTFITYDNEKSVEAKAQYALDNGLGGVMYWEYVNDIDGDLLTVMHETLNK
ncbi:MAG: glycoside hydrolase family 18 protein [Cellulosilyticaceae bacterium]